MAVTSGSSQTSQHRSLLQGVGEPLGRHARRYEMGERSIIRLLHDQAQAYGAKDWMSSTGGII
jgi:hypothetical protein